MQARTRMNTLRTGDDADKSEDESEEGGMCKVEERRHVRETLEEQWPRVQRSEASADRTGSGPRLVSGRH